MKSLYLPPIAVLLLASVPAQAQQQDMTAGDVGGYVEQIRRDAASMMKTDEPEQLLEWAKRNLAEGAVFQVAMNVLADGEHKAYSSMTVETQDILRMVGLLAGAFEQGAFKDYALEAKVGEVVSLGPRAATATVNWTERFTLNAAGLLGGAEQPKGEGLKVEATAACTHLFQREQDRMQIGLSTCSVELRLS